MAVRRIIILGSTGSIGTQTLDVVQSLNAAHAQGKGEHRYEVVGLAAGSNTELLKEQARRFNVRHLAIGAEEISAPCRTWANEAGVLLGPDAAEHLVRSVDCDVVVSAIVGVAGLAATLAAVKLGRDVALANKETLVAAGELVIPAAVASGSRLLPVDSEHAGAWQALACVGCVGPGLRDLTLAPPMNLDGRVRKLTLTASGGPFRTATREEIEHATPAQALKHPTWSMGKKVTIDSASLMNKALELIEAHWLFGLAPDRLDAIIHPQSLVHAFVEYCDGSVLAQLGAADMRCPIQVALTWPGRAPGAAKRLDPMTLTKLDFEAPDHARFPALKLAYRVMEKGGTAGAILNAANEAAVRLFLQPGASLKFGQIGRLAGEALEEVPTRPLTSLEDCLQADAMAREFVARRLGLRAAVTAR
ncbi:MAG: 1-deoxy-D-xylulose-5-phosphate reductoisomerase [Tepidisphaera sp.]|nr:1-deoxy-D-xylulose-5-phosphate reductoisomerase [Tepidisphaera sp.]